MKKVQLFFDEGQKFDVRNVKNLVGLVGLYFISNREIRIRYPVRESRLIYIGMSEKRTNSIGRRLQSHHEGISGNAGITNYLKVNQLYFNHINFEMLKKQWSLNVESLESFFISSFVERYGVYPICNNKSGYDIPDSDLRVHLEMTRPL